MKATSACCFSPLKSTPFFKEASGANSSEFAVGNLKQLLWWRMKKNPYLFLYLNKKKKSLS